MKLKDAIGFDPKSGRFTIGTHDLTGKPLGNDMQASAAQWQGDVQHILSELSTLSAEDHLALAAAIVEPIEKVVPYVEMYNVFYQDVNYGDLEDNAIPVEDTVTIAWETHQDGAARPVRSGFSWTRPEFTTYDTAIEVPWAMARKAGWNFLARQMRRATEDLARKRDEKAKNIFVAALPAANVVTVSGGALTKASVNTVIKTSKDNGFPVLRALANPGTLSDMADFVWPVGLNLPDARAEQMLTTMYLTNYGGVDWYVNPHAPTDRIKFAGSPAQVGWHQTRGSVRNSSDIDILNKRDLYLIEDQEHAYFIGNDISLWEIRITA